MNRLITAAAFALIATGAQADYSLSAMPKKFQGTWIDAEDRSYSMAIGPKAVIIGEPLKLLSIVPCDEKLNCVNIKWQAGLGQTEMVYRLLKIDGRQAMIQVNAESPSSGMGVYWKK